MKRDPFGFTRLYYDAERAAPTIRALLARDRTLDRDAVAAHLAGEIVTARTCFAAIRSVKPGHELLRIDDAWTTQPVPPPVAAGDLLALLRAAIARILESAPRPLAVALSGGLDSAVILAIVHELDPSVGAIVLAPGIPDYDERDEALATAEHVGVATTVFDLAPGGLLHALPRAIAAFETPLYNLHPVGKYALASWAHGVGIASVISGDGIDQVFTRDVSADYLPLTSAAFTSAGVALHAPFLDPGVVAHVLSLPPDPDKRALREVAAALRVRDTLVTGRKVSRLAPPLPIEERVPLAMLERLADLLERPLPALATDRDRVRWSTLALLVEAFEAWD